MNVYRVFAIGAADVVDLIVAPNRSRAVEIFRERTGTSAPLVCRKQPNRRLITVSYEDGPPGTKPQTLQAATWARRSPEGVLASTEA